MPVTITAQALGGTHNITISGEDEKEAIQKIALFSSLPPVCTECSAALFFTYRKVKAKEGKRGGEYFGLKCMGEPAHEKYFHVHDNESKSLYWIEKEKFQLEFAARSGEDERGYSGGEREQWSDNPPQEQQAQQAQTAPPITDAQKTAIKQWLEAEGLTQAWAQNRSQKLFGCHIQDLTAVQGARAINLFKKELEGAAF